MSSAMKLIHLQAELRRLSKEAAIQGDFQRFKGLQDVMYNTDNELMECIAHKLYLFNRAKEKRAKKGA